MWRCIPAAFSAAAAPEEPRSCSCGCNTRQGCKCNPCRADLWPHAGAECSMQAELSLQHSARTAPRGCNAPSLLAMRRCIPAAFSAAAAPEEPRSHSCSCNTRQGCKCDPCRAALQPCTRDECSMQAELSLQRSARRAPRGCNAPPLPAMRSRIPAAFSAAAAPEEPCNRGKQCQQCCKCSPCRAALQVHAGAECSMQAELSLRRSARTAPQGCNAPPLPAMRSRIPAAFSTAAAPEEPRGAAASRMHRLREGVPGGHDAAPPPPHPHRGEAVRLPVLREELPRQLHPHHPPTHPHRGEAVPLRQLRQELRLQLVAHEAPPHASAPGAVMGTRTPSRCLGVCRGPVGVVGFHWVGGGGTPMGWWGAPAGRPTHHRGSATPT